MTVKSQRAIAVERRREDEIKRKLDRELERTLQRNAVIQALKNGSRHCSHKEHMQLTRDENNHYVSFLQHLNRTLATLASNPSKCDAGFLAFLPKQSMREAFRDMGVESVSEFINKPLVSINLNFSIRETGLPIYIAYLHPQYVSPKQ